MMTFVDEFRLDAKQILTRLIGRYGQAHGLYLFGEVCLLHTLGYEAFLQRHTPNQLQVLAEQLRPLALWPHPDPLPGNAPEAVPQPEDPLMTVARSLLPAPLVLALGIDLFLGYWAIVEQSGQPDAWFEPARAALVETLGFVPPRLIVTLGEGLPAHTYRLYLDGEVVEEGEAYIGLDLVLGPEHDVPPALPYGWRADPAGPGWVSWMPVGPEADVPELPRLHWLTAVSRHLSAALPRHADKLLTVPRVQALLREAESAGYDRELERYVSLPELRLVFQRLLSQGLPLRPIAPILESMVTAILAELARRPLTPPELERINRQLPAFSTGFLLEAVRKGLGLPAEAPPRFRMPPPSLPLPVRPAVSPDALDAWRSLALAAEAELGCARFWMAVLRHQATPTEHRSGEYMHLVTPLAPCPPIAEAAWPKRPTGARIAGALRDYVEVSRPLARVKAWLDGTAPLDAEAQALLEDGDFATTRYRLQSPRRLVAATQAEAHLEAYVSRHAERV